jgi:peptidoglycan/xylan/chitin deacetylase (PgdA/CDA1 family)
MWNLGRKIIYPHAQYTPSKPGIHLSFDDGPHPQSTPEILQILAKHRVKASFFCLGKNIMQYPEIVQDIQMHGHILGYHGYYHTDPTFQTLAAFKKNITVPKEWPIAHFRPPYGRIRPDQFYYAGIQPKQWVFWNLLIHDFKPKFNVTKAEKQICSHLQTPKPLLCVMHDGPHAPQTPELLNKILDQAAYNAIPVVSL